MRARWLVIAALVACKGKAKERPPEPVVVAATDAAPADQTASHLPRSTDAAAAAAKLAWKPAALPLARDVPAKAAFGDALDVDGGRILVGAPGADFTDGVPGSAHLYEQAGGAWKRIAVWKSAEDGFGESVALSGDRAAVSSHAGRIHVFERAGKAWKETAVITAPLEDGRAPYSVALDLDGELLAVGVQGVKLGTKYGAGQVTLYGRNPDGSWSERANLMASDAQKRADRDEQPNFGWEVLLRGGTLVVSARQAKCESGVDMCGAVYLFRNDGGAWAEELTLPTHELARWTILGFAMAAGDGGVAILASGERRGWMLARGAAGWTETGTIDLPPEVAGAKSGHKIAIGGAYAALSEYGVPGGGRPPVKAGTVNEIDTEALGAERGATGGVIHLFGRTATGWESHGDLTWPADQPGSALGTALAISGTTVVAGAPDADGQRGAVVVWTP